MSTVLKDALALSVEDRLELIQEIWDSLPATPDVISVTDAHRGGTSQARTPKVRRLRLTPEAELDHAWSPHLAHEFVFVVFVADRSLQPQRAHSHHLHEKGDQT